MDMDDDRLSGLSPAAKDIVLRIETVTRAQDALEILRSDFAALPADERKTLVMDYFLKEMKLDDPQFLALASAELAEPPRNDDALFEGYVFAEFFAAVAEAGHDSTVIPALQKHVGVLTDEEYRRPEILSLALRQAFQEALQGSQSDDENNAEIIPGDLKNPFRAAAEKAAQDNGQISVPSHAHLRKYLGKKK